MNWTLPDGSTFAGNHAVKEQLSALLRSGSFPHAVLIEGPVGSGRRTLGRWLAMAAVCHEAAAPCGVCSACRKAQNGIHPDITELGGDGEARSFHVDVVRRVREDAQILPNDGDRRVFLLCDVQAMSDQAQNALLKILEEPPAHVRFILTCEHRSQLLETVQSRVFPITLSGVSVEEAVAVLRQRLPQTSTEELTRAATLWGGVIGQAVRSLQDGSYADILRWLPPLANGIVSSKELDLLKATAPLEKEKQSIPAILSGLQLLLRDALCLRSGNTALLGTDETAAKTLAHALSRKQLLDLLAVLDELEISRRFNMNHTLFITILCSRLRKAAGR